MRGADWTVPELKEIVAEYKAVTIPVNISFKGRQKVLDLGQVERILRNTDLISIEPCMCRLKVRGCDGPIDACIMVGAEAKTAIEKRNAKKVGLRSALQTLKKSHEAGLVHLAYELQNGEIMAVCSCCSCCCHSLAAITRFGFDDSIVGRGDVVAVHVPRNCTDCGVCVERCHFRAWRIKGNSVRHDQARCTGCGICISFCPSRAIVLKPRAPTKRRKVRSS